MNQQEKEQWFWEQCPVVKDESNINFANGYPCYDSLDDLFEYAVPKLKEILNYPKEVHGFPGERYKFHGFLQRWIYTIAIKGKDPADSLFELIYKALGGEK